MNKNFKNMSIGGIASVIAGAYYLYGSRDGEAKRKQVSAWTLKMKGEVLERIEKLKEVSEPKYKEIVKVVSAKYAKIDKGEVKKVVDEMHSTWNKMKKEVQAEIAKKEEIIARDKGTLNAKLNAKMAKGKSTKPVAKKSTKKAVATKKAPAKKVTKVSTAKPAEAKTENSEQK